MFFLFSEVPTKEIGALSKKLKSHIFSFYSAPGQISLSLHQIWVLPTHKVNNVFLFLLVSTKEKVAILKII